jgi:hypothetical protein
MSEGTYAVTIEWRAFARQAIKITQAANLIAYWELNEFEDELTALDSSGNDLSATHAADVVAGVYGVGDGTLAARYEANTHTHIYSAGLNSAFDGALGTVVFAFRASDSAVWTDGAWRTLVHLKVDGNNEVIFYKPPATGTVEAEYKAGGVWTGRSLSVSDGAWHWAAITWNKADNRMRAYLDGSQVGGDFSGLGTWAGSLSSADTVIGANTTSNGNPWDGLLAHVGIWDVELTAAEIADIHDHLTNYDTVTNDVLRFDCQRGFANTQKTAAKVGNGRLKLDNGWVNNNSVFALYSLENSSKPLFGVLSEVRPEYMLPRIKVECTFSATTYTLFTGWVVGATVNQRDHSVVLQLVDAMHHYAYVNANIPLQENIDSDDVVQELVTKAGGTWFDQGTNYCRIDYEGWASIGDAIISPTTLTGRSLDAGLQSWDFVGDTWLSGKVRTLKALEDTALAEGGRFFADADGNVVFWDRLHEYEDITSQGTLSETMKGVTFRSNRVKAVTRTRVRIRPRTTGTPGTVLAQMTQTRGIRLRRRTKSRRKGVRERWATVELHYQDPDGGGRLYGAKDVITPVPVTDFTSNTSPDGSGDDVTLTKLQYKLQVLASSVIGKFRRKSFFPKGYLMTFQVRGTPLIVEDEQTFVRQMDNIQPVTQEYNMKLGDDSDFADDWARLKLSELSSRTSEKTVTLENHSDGVYTQMLARDLLDLVTLVENESGVSGDHRIWQIRHRISPGARHEVQWRCQAANEAKYLVIGDGKISENTIGPF